MAKSFKTSISIDDAGSAASEALKTKVAGDSNARLSIDAGGKLTWGSGSATGDATLYRSAANALKTDDTLEAALGLITTTSSGAPSSSLSDGAIAVDTTNNAFYFRSGSTWRQVTGGGGASLTTSDTAPSSPSDGDLWYETDTGKTLVYYEDGSSNQWVEVGASPAAAATYVGVLADDDGDTKIQVEESSDDDIIRFDTAGSERVVINASGNVGIGTSSPATALHIQTATQYHGLKISDANTTIAEIVGFASGNDEGGLKLYNAGTAKVQLLSNGVSYLNGGNVGIGTSSPTHALHVDGTVKIEGASSSLISNNTGSGREVLQIRAKSATTDGAGVNMYGDGDSTHASKTFFYNDSSTPTMTMLPSGNVGIGTSSPEKLLHVYEGNSGATPSASHHVFLESDGDMGVLIASGASSNGYLRFGDSGHQAAGGFNYDHANDSLKIRTALTDHVTIDSSGNVGIGTGSPAALLHVAGNLMVGGTIDGPSDFYVGNGDGEQIYFSGNQTFLMSNGTWRAYFTSTGHLQPYSSDTYDLGVSGGYWDDVYATNGTIQTSDERDKGNVTNLDLGLSFINALRPVSYTWDTREGYVGTRTHMGFTAQEVATALGDQAASRAVWIDSPAGENTNAEGETVSYDARQGLRYEQFIAPLVKAVQELTTRLEALESA